MTEDVGGELAQVLLEKMEPSQKNFEIFYEMKNLIITLEALNNIARAGVDSAPLLDSLIGHG